MSIVHVGHIKSTLQKRFQGLVDLSDVSKQATPEQLTHFFLTRSLAAYALTQTAQIDDKVAAEAVVDGGQDNGIDAIYYDAAEKLAYLVQSKWIGSVTERLTLERFKSLFRGAMICLK
jgi:hypothetical protein